MPRGFEHKESLPGAGAGDLLLRKQRVEHVEEDVHAGARPPSFPSREYLLTGERREVVLLEPSYQRRRRVFALNFAPWISKETSRKAYRKCRKVV